MRHLYRAHIPLLLALCALGAAAYGPAAIAKRSPAKRPALNLVIGVSDNGEWMFEEPLFQRLHVRTARLITPWDVAVMHDKTQLRAAAKWVSSAHSDGVEPMVSFTGDGSYVPSVPVYTAAIKAFLHDFPRVKVYTPWNEPDWIYRSLANEPWLAAGYFNTLAYWCHHCTVVAGDVYRPASDGLAAWVSAYSRYLHARPKAWALHPYDDVRSHTTAQIDALQSVTSGPIWLTEISGVERRGHWGFPNQSPNGANNDERFLFSLPKRFHRIQRIYHYMWQAVPWAPWDSGLVGPQGKPRPAYWTFANALRGRLP
jgi:Glycosyl hydrolase catalytic core